jgi:DNA-binding CsgD family transcriptional regulator
VIWCAAPADAAFGVLPRLIHHECLRNRVFWPAGYALTPFGRTVVRHPKAAPGLGRRRQRRTVLRQARDILQRRPGLGVVPTQVEELGGRLDAVRGGTVGVASLTTAELRLLPLLPTHLTFGEISQRLYLSPHTVKAQAISLYRKLGVSSRSKAVERLQQLGIDARPRLDPLRFVVSG